MQTNRARDLSRPYQLSLYDRTLDHLAHMLGDTPPPEPPPTARTQITHDRTEEYFAFLENRATARGEKICT